MDKRLQVIESNLPWGMVLYGEEEEEMMANSEDPIIQTIWNEKIVAPYNAVPQIKQGVYGYVSSIKQSLLKL